MIRACDGSHPAGSSFDRAEDPGPYDSASAPLRFAIIVHYLSLTRKAQFVPRDPLQIGGVAPEGADILGKFCIVLLESDDLFRKGIVLRLHTVVFHHSHLSQKARGEKVEREKNPGRNEDFFSAGGPGDPIGPYIVPFSHGYDRLRTQ